MKKTVFYFNRIATTHQIIQYQINYNKGTSSKVRKIDYKCIVSK